MTTLNFPLNSPNGQEYRLSLITSGEAKREGDDIVYLPSNSTIEFEVLRLTEALELVLLINDKIVSNGGSDYFPSNEERRWFLADAVARKSELRGILLSPSFNLPIGPLLGPSGEDMIVEALLYRAGSQFSGSSESTSYGFSENGNSFTCTTSSTATDEVSRELIGEVRLQLIPF